MRWQIKHIFNYPAEKPWGNGYAHFGFHDRNNNQYMLQWDEHWLGQLTPDDEFTWTAGALDKGLSQTHIEVDVKHPHYVSESPDGSLTLSSNGNNRIYKIWPREKRADLFIDTGKLGFVDVGNCVYDRGGNLWLHEIEGCRVWQLDRNGKIVALLGNGKPGFHRGTVSFGQAQFSWIYDMRLGPDGDMYVLGSRNFAVRRIDIEARTVTTSVATTRCSVTQLRSRTAPARRESPAPFGDMYLPFSRSQFTGFEWRSCRSLSTESIVSVILVPSSTLAAASM